jgi:hypothetical protein
MARLGRQRKAETPIRGAGGIKIADCNDEMIDTAWHE